ncbi:MAG: TonB family protein [Proteobacteria bacterium]|nr:TonB family protein [Pseudomonadota bacterium]MCP4917819.1 TonB family protein [Pseudomonadota bacterium]
MIALIAMAVAAEPRLPEVVYAAPAAYPTEALDAGVEASVLLQLEVSSEGQVVDVLVVEPTGSAFEDAAVLAAQASRFTPAYDAEGLPSGAVIGYRVVFDVEAAPPLSIEGTTWNAETRSPIGDVRIEALGPDQERALAVTSSAGEFELVGLPPGEWTLLATGPGLVPELLELELTAGTVAQAELYLIADTEASGQSDLEIVIEEERISAEIGERRLTAEEIQYLPGTSGDVVKVVQNLPGVARAPLGTGNLIIRGTAPEDSATYLDGSPIPLVFHFAGLTSVVPGDALEEVAFVPGNASVRYGRVLGGVVDLRTTTALPEEGTGLISIDLYQSSLFIEQRLGERTAVTIAGRRSYIDAVLSPLLSNTDTGLKVQAPRYYDGQIRLVHEADATWDLLVFGSDDRFRFLGAEEDEVFASYADRFLRARVRRLREVGDVQHETTLSLGPEIRFFEFGDESEAYERDLAASLREEVAVAPTAGRPIGFRAGLDVLAGEQSFLFDVGRTEEEGTSLYVAPGAYAEATVQAGRLAVTPGVRVDGWGFDNGYRATTVDPRISLRYAPWPSTVFRGAVGRYSSFPTLRQVDPGADGTLDLTASRSLQASVGAQQQLGDSLSVEVVGYISELSDLVVGREDRLRFFNGPPPVGPFDTDPYANDGVGRSVGSELLVRYDGVNSTGMLAATWSSSSRQDRPDEEVELFAYDQPLVLTALWSQKLGRDFRVGARVRAGSGNPYTPVVNRYFDLGSRSFVPVYGDRSSGRLPPFFSLDLRVDKSWAFARWDLGAYLEVQNATNARNAELMAWNTDYSKETPITSNPPLPVFGVRGSW